MTEHPPNALPQKEQWGSRLGVVLAVAGSAVGLGNFLRFPGQAVNNGGGAFMIPYILSFLLLGIPIAWIEWTMGRIGSHYRQNSSPGIYYALWRRAPAKSMGALALMIPVVIYTYYVMLEAWCLDYCIEFARGGFRELFGTATAGAADHSAEVSQVIAASEDHFVSQCGLKAHGALFEGSRIIWVLLACFVANFVIIYNGVTKGIERFCKFAMPALIGCAVLILLRVLTLPNIGDGLGFMWNPQWTSLSDPSVWLAAAGQIFFSLSVGFGIIVCYSSYLRPDQDVVLTSLSASSTNEFCEVVLGGLIVVPTAFLFLGAGAAQAGTFGLGFTTIPAIMNFMPSGNLIGAVWFGLLFVAAITSSLSMLQPAIAFLEDGFGLRRRSSVAILGIITALGALPTIYFTKGALALDHTDFWCNLSMIVLATLEVLLFGWIIGARRGVRELNRGADFRVPGFVAVLMRYITPAFLLIILFSWAWQNAPGYIERMSPQTQGIAAERAVYADAIAAHVRHQAADAVAVADEQVAVRVEEILGAEGTAVTFKDFPKWLRDWRIEVPPEVEDEAPVQRPIREMAQAARAAAAQDASIARMVLLGVVVFLIALLVISDLACRGRIGESIQQAEASGARWDETS
jgi:NSS family neurotransmitter:Na+ symporter